MTVVAKAAAGGTCVRERARALLSLVLLQLAALLVTLLPGAAGAQPVSNPYDYTRTSAFAYDASGLLVSETVEPDLAPQCVTTTYTYDAWGNKNSATTASCSGAAGLALFDSRKALSVANAVPLASPSIPAGTPMTVLVKGVSVTVPVGTFVRTSYNDLNHSEVRDIDPRFGAPVKLTGPNGLDTLWTLDDFGRVVREVRPDGTRIRTNYCYFSMAELSSNSAGCADIFASVPPAEVPALAVYAVQTQQVNAADAPLGAFSRVYHDRAGRKLRTATASFDGSRSIVQDTDYNEFGAAVITTQPYFADSGRSVVATGAADYGMSQTQYDTLGRPTVIHTIDPQGSQNGSVSNPQVSYGSRRAAATSTKTTITYAGLTTTTVSEGVTRIELKNPDGRLVRTSDTYGAQLLHQHDAFGNLIYTRDALQKTTAIEYDARGRKLTLADADTGRSTYCYDALGQLKAQQTANQRSGAYSSYACPSVSGAGSSAPVISGPSGAWSSYGYDTLGRMRQRREPGDYTTSWTFDKYADNSSCNKGTGKLCEVVTDHGVRRRYVYDNLGRPQNSRLDANNNAIAAAIAVSYDANGRVDSQTYPTGLKLRYGYHSVLGYLTGVSTATTFTVGSKTINAGTVLWQPLSVNAWGRAEAASMPSTDGANPLRNWVSFEPATGRITSQQSGTSQASPSAVSLSYAWNSRNLLTSRNDAIGVVQMPSGVPVATLDTFTHDDLGRLTQYQSSGQGPTARTVTLSYNAAGMLLNKSDVGSYSYVGSTYGHVHALQAVTSTAIGGYSAIYGYDANGNMVFQGGNGAKSGASSWVAPRYTALSYTSFNMLASINTDAGSAGSSGRPYYTYQYDERHQRIKETRKRDGVTGTTWYLQPDNQGGLGFEREEGASIANRHYLSAGGQVFAVLVTSAALPALSDAQMAPPTTGFSITALKLEYWHRDHIGNLVATSDHNGATTNRFSYDPFGKRRYLNSSYDPFGNIVVDWTTASPAIAGPDRGFTGHEHLDDVGIVNMNGRVYDPLLARFMQADPFIQDPTNLQNFDRYAYCFNSPLVCTDPTGYFSLRKFLRAVVAIAIAVWAPELLTYFGASPGGALIAAGGQLTVTGAAVAGFASGAVMTGSLKGALQGAFTGAVFAGVGDFIQGNAITDKFAQVALHGVAGCVTSEAGGGQCGPGALSAAFSKVMVVGEITKGMDKFSGAIVSAVVGGTGSVLGGGKFANGAQTGAFSYLFNECMHTQMCGTSKIEVTGNVAAGGVAGRATNPTSLHLSIEITDGYAGPLSLEGQPSCIFCSSDNRFLITELNKPNDGIRFRYDLGAPAGFSLSSFGSAMMRAADGYCNCNQYSFPSIPSGAMAAGTYNSNSYVSGILTHVTGSYYSGVPAAASRQGFQVPGFANPMPR